jgi:hypothetical protein
MSDWYGIWSDTDECWMVDGSGSGLTWGPRCVMVATLTDWLADISPKREVKERWRVARFRDDGRPE